MPALGDSGCAQEGPARMMLEVSIDSGNGVACPGHYVGILGLPASSQVCWKQDSS